LALHRPPPSHIRFARAIDRFTDRTSLIIAWLNVPLVAVVVYEVAARYLFGAPTIWSFDMTYMLYAAVFMLGAAYALHQGAHVRTDFFFERWSARTRGMIDAIAYLVFFFPALTLFLIVSGGEAWYAYEIGETSEQTPWRPLLWPFKAVIPLTCLLLMIQGVSETLKALYAIRTGVELERTAKFEA
jgi:TRAP-type mannitol/chloroaromatic compound transport system permease small subunit